MLRLAKLLNFQLNIEQKQLNLFWLQLVTNFVINPNSDNIFIA